MFILSHFTVLILSEVEIYAKLFKRLKYYQTNHDYRDFFTVIDNTTITSIHEDNMW